MYLKSAALLWLIANVVDSEARLARVAAALSLMSVPAALTALHNYAAGVFVPGSSHARISGYGAPLTENPNDLALLLNLVLPLTVVQLLQTRGRPGLRALLQAVLAVQVAGIVVTFSRSGFLTLALSLALLAARHARRGRWGVPAALAVAVLVALPLVPGRYLDRISTLRAIGSDPTGSAQARWDDAVAAAGFVAGSPLLGAGAGMNVLALNEARGEKWRAVHNVYLEYAVDLGVPGLALFLALLFSCLAAARAGRRAAAGPAPPTRLAAVSEGLEIALLAFALAGMFHPVAYQFYFHLLAGLAVAARRISSPGAGTARGDGREPHGAVLR
jgi:O-antigen ligase